MPSVPKAVSSGARRRSTDGQTTPIRSGAVPPRMSSRISWPTSSSEPRGPAPSKKRTAPSTGGAAGGGGGEGAGSARGRGVGEERALDVRDRRVGDIGPRGGQLLDAAAGEPGQRFRRAAECGERGAPGLVRKRDGYVGAAGDRPQEPPFRRGQVLEAVGEDRLPLPGLEVALEPLDGVRAEQV